MQFIKEGMARVKVYKGVFYNPRMKGLRDLSVLFLKSSLNGGSVLDGTSATGVRGIRYLLESGISNCTFVDISSAARRNISANIKLNCVKGSVSEYDFQGFSNLSKDGFDAIELDPFGSPTPLVYDSMKVSRDGTMLMVTATDTAVLCGADFQACMRTYGSRPIHNGLCHEGAVRILIAYILRNAAQFGFGIKPMLYISDMHYLRVFLRLEKGAVKSTESVRRIGFLDYCGSCNSFASMLGIPKARAECCSCGNATERSGPMWLGSISDKTVTESMLSHGEAFLDRHTSRLLRLIHDEIDTQFFYYLPRITRTMRKGSVSSDKVIESLRGSGFSASRTSFTNFGVKTNAGISEVTEAVERL